jgi:HEAT repeat protein
MTGPQTVATLLAEMCGSNRQKRESASEILARLDEETLASGLLSALRHQESYVRRRAVELVGYYRHEESLLQELTQLSGGDPVAVVREAASTTLEEINLKLTISTAESPEP